MYNKLLVINKKNYAYNFVYTNTPNADGYNVKLDTRNLTKIQ